MREPTDECQTACMLLTSGACAVAQIFLEPEGRDTPELYVQGFSTGLPERLQLALLHSLPGAAYVPSTDRLTADVC